MRDRWEDGEGGGATRADLQFYGESMELADTRLNTSAGLLTLDIAKTII